VGRAALGVYAYAGADIEAGRDGNARAAPDAAARVN